MVHNIFDIEGMLFPAGRKTRVIVGPGAPAEAENFVMGHVTIFPDGEVPEHAHPQEEVYFIAQGNGTITLNGKLHSLQPGSYVHISPNISHHLQNTSDGDLIMLFCYSPKSVVDHWQEELQGTKD